MAKESKVVAEFLNFISERERGSKAICEYYAGLSNRKLNSLISDPYWNRYPLWTSGWPAQKLDRRSFGPSIGSSVHDLCEFVPKLRRLFVKRSEGILLCHTMDAISGKDRLRAANRAIKSKDGRARLRAANILPVNALKRYLTESTTPSIRTLIVRRIGLENCHHLLGDDYSSYYGSLALKSSDTIDKDYALTTLSSIMSNPTASWCEKRSMVYFMSKLSDDDLLFFLDKCDSEPRLGVYIRKRLSYSSLNSEGGTSYEQ